MKHVSDQKTSRSRRPGALERHQQARTRQENPPAETAVSGVAPGTTLVKALEGTAEGVFEMFSRRVTLARHELVQDLTVLGKSSGGMVVGGVVALFGYLMLNIAAILLSAAFGGGALGAGVCALIIALLNLTVGGLLAVRHLRNMKTSTGQLHLTREELQKDRKWLQEIQDRPSLPAPQEP